MSCEIIRESKGIRCRYFDVVSKDEMDTISGVIRTDPSFSSIRYVIADFTAMTWWKVTAYEALILAYHDHSAYSKNPSVKIALVSTMDDVLSILNTYAKSPLMTFDVKVFTSMSAARGWLAAYP